MTSAPRQNGGGGDNGEAASSRRCGEVVTVKAVVMTVM